MDQSMQADNVPADVKMSLLNSSLPVFEAFTKYGPCLSVSVQTRWAVLFYCDMHLLPFLRRRFTSHKM